MLVAEQQKATKIDYAFAVQIEFPDCSAAGRSQAAALSFTCDLCASCNSRKNHPGASAIGAQLRQRYCLPLVWSEGATTIAPPSPLMSRPGPNFPVEFFTGKSGYLRCYT